ENILLIKEFKSTGLAKNYAENLQKKVIDIMKNMGDVHFIITSANYVKLLEFKEEEKYLQFYKERY
ncbi:MAG: hypothetical protein ACJAZ2_001555, partial [Glaciecola sp.]